MLVVILKGEGALDLHGRTSAAVEVHCHAIRRCPKHAIGHESLQSISRCGLETTLLEERGRREGGDCSELATDLMVASPLYGWPLLGLRRLAQLLVRCCCMAVSSCADSCTLPQE